MADPAVDELLEEAFKFGQEHGVDMLEPGLDWPDNIVGQRRVIRFLIWMTTTTVPPGLPHQWRLWAFNKLREIGRDYLDRGAMVPSELTTWGFGVWTGKIKPPKRARQRPAANKDIKKTIQNRQIVAFVAWLQEEGHVEDEKEAIKRVADAAGLTRKRVKDILKDWK